MDSAQVPSIVSLHLVHVGFAFGFCGVPFIGSLGVMRSCVWLLDDFVIPGKPDSPTCSEPSRCKFRA